MCCLGQCAQSPGHPGARALNSRAASVASPSSWSPAFPAGSDTAPVYWGWACAANGAQPLGFIGIDSSIYLIPETWIQVSLEGTLVNRTPTQFRWHTGAMGRLRRGHSRLATQFCAWTGRGHEGSCSSILGTSLPFL